MIIENTFGVVVHHKVPHTGACNAGYCAPQLVGNDFDKAELISFIHSNFGHFALYKGHTVDFL